MEYSAIFHDMDKRFCYAIDKDLFVIRVQVKKDDMKEVILHYEDKYIPIERKDTRMTLPMKKVATSQFHDYYEAQLQMHLICLRYFFEFTDMQGEKVYYGNYEFDKECITNRDRMFRFFRRALPQHSRWTKSCGIRRRLRLWMICMAISGES